MKVLLTTLQPHTDTIGLKYIHSYLNKNNIDSSILFIPRYDNKAKTVIGEFLKNYNPDIIGIGLMSIDFYNARDLTNHIKKHNNKIIVVWGGIHPTIEPEECLMYADYVFVGESEEAFLEFINAIKDKRPINNIENMAYKSYKAITNRLRPSLSHNIKTAVTKTKNIFV